MVDNIAPSSKHNLVASWIFGSFILLFYMGVFIFAPVELPEFKHKMLAIFSALLCAIFTFFFVGSLNVTLQLKSKWTKLGVQSGGGGAAFVLVLLWWNNPNFAPIKSEEWQATKATIERTDKRTEQLRIKLENSENIIQDLRAKLDDSHKVIETLRDNSDRQLQEVMAEFVQLDGKQIWDAPNAIFPGSIVKLYGFTCDLVLRYGDRNVILPGGNGDSTPVETSIMGNSGLETKWSLENRTIDFCQGKVHVLSSPRIRSVEDSWKEEGNRKN